MMIGWAQMVLLIEKMFYDTTRYLVYKESK